MENETVKHLWALQQVNRALITGLKTAVFVMEKWDHLGPERRKSMIESLQGLVSQCDAIYGTQPGNIDVLS
ncbi:MAG: hypothetical protein JRJ03_00220 [Deltaproteobacteria bacterium]|nr:hypothetical protein [Deltaproteobacteria bacterium]